MDADHWLILDLVRRRMPMRCLVIALVTLIVVTSGQSFLEAVEPTDLHGTDAIVDARFSSLEESGFDDPEAADFGEWETLVEDDSRMQWDAPAIKPIDWVRHFGFRHSSSHGRHVGKGLPLEGTSVLNRPFHFDWFVGPLLGDDLISNRVSQGNVLLGGFRLGWDFDYYWGLEWRFGRADPKADYTDGGGGASNEVSYSVSDIDLIYYPWGDTKVRPYFMVGVGATQLDFFDENSVKVDTTLASLPFGGGVQFRQSSWLMWRIDVIDNLSLGGDDVATMNNVSITAGMELRFGARPRSYWPWRSSRRIW